MAGNSGGGAGPGKVAVPEQAQRLTNIATKIMKGAGPVRNEILQQMLEGLTTGGINARIPLVQRAVEATNQAGSQALRGTQESLARTGLAGTPFGQRTEAAARQQTALTASRVPQDIIGRILAGAPGFVANQQGAALGALSNAGSFQFAADANNAAGWRAFMQDLKSSIMAATTKGAGGGGGGDLSAAPGGAEQTASAAQGVDAGYGRQGYQGSGYWGQ